MFVVGIVEGIGGQAFNATLDDVQVVIICEHPRVPFFGTNAAFALKILLDLGQCELC